MPGEYERGVQDGMIKALQDRVNGVEEKQIRFDKELDKKFGALGTLIGNKIDSAIIPIRETLFGNGKEDGGISGKVVWHGKLLGWLMGLFATMLSGIVVYAVLIRF